MALASVAAVRWLHETFETFYRGSTEDPTDGDKERDHPRAKEIRAVRLNYQRFSDGILFYVSLNGPEPEVVNGLYGLIISAGALCFLGLTEQHPIRGGIAIAWGAELNVNELYGCVVARAYELESQAAIFPRVVIGDHVIGYLESVIRLDGDDIALEYSRRLARKTLGFLGRDVDGTTIVDYLGAEFRKLNVNDPEEDPYRRAIDFISHEIERWRDAGDNKLLQRYQRLQAYFQDRGIV